MERSVRKEGWARADEEWPLILLKSARLESAPLACTRLRWCSDQRLCGQSCAEAAGFMPKVFGKKLHFCIVTTIVGHSINFCGRGCACAVDVLLLRRTGIVALNPPPVPSGPRRAAFFSFFSSRLPTVNGV